MCRLFIALGLVVVSLFSFAQAKEDVKNSSDHPLVGRYPGTYISQYTHNDYDQYHFPTQANNQKTLEAFRQTFDVLEGERTTIIYDVPNEVTTSLLKVFRSIEKGMISKGFETILSCTGETYPCGYAFFDTVIGENRAPYYSFKNPNHSQDKDSLFYSGKLTKGQDVYYVFIAVAKTTYAQFIQYSVDVLKEENLVTEQLVLSVDKITKSIAEKGTATLTGLYFDHNKTTLTPESETSLNTISEYLKKNKQSKYLIVGHTDTVGDIDYNQKLSLKRAYRVADELRKKGVSTIALEAIGAGMIAPVATNSTEQGRAKNRRVELVLLPTRG